MEAAQGRLRREASCSSQHNRQSVVIATQPPNRETDITASERGRAGGLRTEGGQCGVGEY